MKNYELLFIDLDDTLTKTRSGETFPKGVYDMELRMEVLEAIKTHGFRFVAIVTNQAGIEKGYVDETQFLSKLDYVSNCIVNYCNVICLADYCKSNDKRNCLRKPNVGMLNVILQSISTTYNTEIDKESMLMVGDASGKPGDFSDSDKQTAVNFGIDYLDVEEFCAEFKKPIWTLVPEDVLKDRIDEDHEFTIICHKCNKEHKILFYPYAYDNENSELIYAGKCPDCSEIFYVKD